MFYTITKYSLEVSVADTKKLNTLFAGFTCEVLFIFIPYEYTATHIFICFSYCVTVL